MKKGLERWADADGLAGDMTGRLGKPIVARRRSKKQRDSKINLQLSVVTASTFPAHIVAYGLSLSCPYRMNHIKRRIT